MGACASRIQSTGLFTELEKSSRRGGIEADEVTQLQGLVLGVADLVGPHLDQIQQTFEQYTQHNLEHSRNVAEHMARIVPGATLAQLNALELSLLLLAALLHDVGMVVSTQEGERSHRQRSSATSCSSRAQSDCGPRRPRGSEEMPGERGASTRRCLPSSYDGTTRSAFTTSSADTSPTAWTFGRCPSHGTSASSVRATPGRWRRITRKGARSRNSPPTDVLKACPSTFSISPACCALRTSWTSTARALLFLSSRVRRSPRRRAGRSGTSTSQYAAGTLTRRLSPTRPNAATRAFT